MTERSLAVGVALVAAAGAAAWLWLRDPEPDAAPVPDEIPDVPPPPARTADRSGSAPREAPLPPREGLWQAAEALPRREIPQDLPMVRLAAAGATEGRSQGADLIDAILASGEIWVRYRDEAVRERARAASVRVPPPAWMPRESPMGLPLPQALDLLRGSGLEVTLQFPVVYLGGGAPEEPESSPR